jgi:hypothetical protein
MSVEPSDVEALRFREDLSEAYRALRPKTIGCLSVMDLSWLPLTEFLNGESRVWLANWQPGRPDEPDAGLAGSSAHLDPAAVPRLHVADGTLGRAACFATRVEELVAVADTPTSALEQALVECRRCALKTSEIAVDVNSLDLVVSVLSPSRMMAEPFAYFEEFATRRFGAWRRDGSRSKIARLAQDLQTELYRMQMEEHVKELRRLVREEGGRVYFATHPLECVGDEGWALEHGIALAFSIMAQYFRFDFDKFPVERFLRRRPAGRSGFVQAALLQPRRIVRRTSRPPETRGDWE